MDFVEVGVLIQLLLAIAQFVVALVMWLSVREIRRDRKRVFLEKRLEEFYIPLINLFGNESLPRNPDKHREVEEIIVSRRHLCGRRVAKDLPEHFTARGNIAGSHFVFDKKEDIEQWENVANAIWDEYREDLKEYCDTMGVKDYVLPKERPKWMFKEKDA
jgi:hypothetical protein